RAPDARRALRRRRSSDLGGPDRGAVGAGIADRGRAGHGLVDHRAGRRAGDGGRAVPLAGGDGVVAARGVVVAVAAVVVADRGASWGGGRAELRSLGRVAD